MAKSKKVEVQQQIVVEDEARTYYLYVSLIAHDAGDHS
jgi:hypothetical protein